MMLFKEGLPNREISSKTSVPKSTVQRIIQRCSNYGSYYRIKGSGRPKALESKDKEIIIQKIQENPKISLAAIKTSIETTCEKSVSKETIRSCLHEANFKSHSSCSKPLLSKKNIDHRFQIAKSWSMWPINKFDDIIWSDECKFEIRSFKGKQKVWRLPGTRYESNNITIYGFFHVEIIGRLL